MKALDEFPLPGNVVSIIKKSKESRNNMKTINETKIIVNEHKPIKPLSLRPTTAKIKTKEEKLKIREEPLDVINEDSNINNDKHEELSININDFLNENAHNNDMEGHITIKESIFTDRINSNNRPTTSRVPSNNKANFLSNNSLNSKLIDSRFQSKQYKEEFNKLFKEEEENQEKLTSFYDWNNLFSKSRPKHAYTTSNQSVKKEIIHKSKISNEYKKLNNILKESNSEYNNEILKYYVNLDKEETKEKENNTYNKTISTSHTKKLKRSINFLKTLST